MAKENAIVKINRRAKAMVKANKKLPWKDAIQKASAEYRSGKLGAKAPAKKAGSIKSRAKNIIHSVRSHAALHTANKKARLKQKCKSLGSVKSDGLALLNAKYGKLAAQKLGAPLLRDKRKIGKEMIKVGAQIRKLISL